MAPKKRTSTKPRSVAKQDPAEQALFEGVDHAIFEAYGFLTAKIVRFIRAIGAAAKRSDSDLIEAGVDLSCELRLADPEEWRRTTGRELPRNAEELRALMVEAGYSPDFISAGEWTPREVGPVLLKRLGNPQASQQGAVDTDTGRKHVQRPAFARDHLWLTWATEIGLDTPNVEGLVRDKWNESPDEARRAFHPHHRKIGRGKPGYDLVRKGIKRAQRDRKAEGES